MIKRFAAGILRAAAGKLEGRASLENPSTSLEDADDDDEWFGGALGGDKTPSGVKITRETAMRHSPFYRGVTLLSRDVAKLPCLVYERDGAGKNRATNHPAFTLLRRKPNREMVSFVFKQLMISLGIVEGNGMAYIDRAGNGDPLELIPLTPGKAFACRENGRKVYIVEVSGELRRIAPEDVFHVMGPTSDGLMGDRLFDRARHSLGLGIAARDYGARFFKNNARPSVVIEHPDKLSDQAAKHLRESWNSIHGGLENSHKVALLEEGMKVNPFSIDANDAQLLETRKFDIVEVANWIGVPPHKLGDSSRTAYNSLEQENQSYLDEALDPWLVAWEEEAYEKLLTEDEKRADTHTVEFLRQALLRADMATRGEFYNKATGGHPWMAVNEVRGLENMNPKKGFDDIKPPTNNFGPPKPAKEKQSRAARAVLVDAARRMAKRLTVHARKAAAKSPVDLDDWIGEDMRRDHTATVAEAFGPVAAVLGVVGREADADVAAERFFKIAAAAIGKRSAPDMVADVEQAALVEAIAAAATSELMGD